MVRNDDYFNDWFYFKLAAEQGYANGQSILGSYYAKGKGVEQSFTKAREWWTKAAKQGQKNAIEDLKKLDEREEQYNSILALQQSI